MFFERPGAPTPWTKWVHGTLAAMLVTLSACAAGEPSSSAPVPPSEPAVVQSSETSPALSPTPTVRDVASSATTRPPLIATTPTATSTTVSTTTSAPSTTTISTTTTIPVGPAVAFDLAADSMPIGTSVDGRPIVAERFGTAGGRRVLVIGVIHGNEDAGVQIVDDLRGRQIPDGVELWLVESMNPDGQLAQLRQNANGVDLNRNFPHEWGPIGVLGDSQYAGPAAASEPETQTMVAFIAALRPDIAIWYHQDANLVIPSTGRDGRIRARYAELTALPIAECCDGGGVYTGIAATWARDELKRDSDAVPFIVELPGGDLDAAQVDQHASAVLTVAAEG